MAVVTTEQPDLLEQLRKRRVGKLFEMAEKYGVIHRGFSGVDYLRYAIKNHGWESTSIGGQKGSAKSNLLLQRGYAIYQDWEKVNRHTITTKDQFIEILDTDQRIPWLAVDDIAALFPRSIYFTDRKLYSELQKNWETLRTIVNCFDFTATRKNKVATFILEDITGDIICYNRTGDLVSHYDYQRWLWLRNLKDPTDMIAKMIRVEEIPFPLTPDAFQVDRELSESDFIASGKVYHGYEFFRDRAGLLGVPRPEFKRYWDRRIALAREAHANFKRLVLGRQKAEPAAQPSVEGSEAGKQLAARRWQPQTEQH